MHSETSSITSLVFSVFSVEKVCPRNGMFLFQSRQNPEHIITGSCGSFKCMSCGPMQVTKRALAVNWAASKSPYARFITLTLVPEDLTVRAAKVRDLRRRLNQEGYPWEFAYCTERNPKNTGWHIHGLQYGPRYVPQRTLEALWGSRVDIRRSHTNAPSSILYASKKGRGGIFYTAKGSKENYIEFMRINGPQPIKWSRDYFRGIAIKEVMKLAMQERNGHPVTWNVVSCPEWVAAHSAQHAQRAY